MRKHIMLGTAGHVDHGKTALVHLLTGCQTDTLAEEQKRGLTIDLGFAPCRLADDRIVGVVDVPGHVDFIRNMVAGAHGIDVVIFVVAADDGIMPQTHEHLHILTLLGVKHGLVALTKIDLVDAPRRAFVFEELRRLLAGTFLTGAPVCPLSNLTGEGYDAFYDALNDVAGACEERSSSGLFRLWVEDVFTIRGAGTVITGIPLSGLARPGLALTLLPSGQTARVRRLQVYGADADEAHAGECVALNVPELDHASVRRGMVLADPEAPAPAVMAEAELRALASLKQPIRDYQEVQVHLGTAMVLARLALLEQPELAAGQQQFVQLRFAEPVPAASGDRFIVRANLPAAGQSGLTTIGGGRVLGTSNARLRRRRPWTLELLRARAQALDDPARWCELMALEHGQPLAPAALRRACRLRPEELSPILESLIRAGRLVVLASSGQEKLLTASGQPLPPQESPIPSGSPGTARPTGATAVGRVVPGEPAAGSVLHIQILRQAEAALVAALEAVHAQNPHRAGLPREELAVAAAVAPGLFEPAVKSLLASRQLQFNGAVFARAGWSPRVADRDESLGAQIEAAFRQAGWTSPGPEELAAALKEPPDRVQKTLRLLHERGVLIKLDDRVSMHRDAVEAARQVALRLFAHAPHFTTMEFRDALAVSRKYAVPLLDFLDRTRFTVRAGHHRSPGAEARKRMPKAEG